MHRKLNLATKYKRNLGAKHRVGWKTNSTFVKGIHVVIGERNLAEKYLNYQEL